MSENELGPQRGTQEPDSDVRRLIPPIEALRDRGLAPQRALSEAVQGRTEAGPRSLEDYRALPKGHIETFDNDSRYNEASCPFDGFYVVIGIPFAGLETDAEWKEVCDRTIAVDVRQVLHDQRPSARAARAAASAPTPKGIDYDGTSIEVERKMEATADVARRIREARAATTEDGE